MPQDPLVFQTATTATHSTLNLTAATVIKATSGRLIKVTIINGGASSGAFSINDCATVAAAAASNLVWTVAFGATIGTVYTLEWPMFRGIVLSAVPGSAGVIAVSWV
jgi:hypothetical protein